MVDIFKFNKEMEGNTYYLKPIPIKYNGKFTYTPPFSFVTAYPSGFGDRPLYRFISYCIINGELKITNLNNNFEFIQEVFDRIVAKKDMFAIREHIIQNETLFSNDYHQLLKDLFETVYKSSLDFNRKRLILLCISNAMYQHQIVMDAEINCFACLLSVAEVLEK